MSEYTEDKIRLVEARARYIAANGNLVGFTVDDLIQESHLVAIGGIWGVDSSVPGFSKYAVSTALRRLISKSLLHFLNEGRGTVNPEPLDTAGELGLDFWDWVSNNLDKEECEYLRCHYLLETTGITKSRTLTSQIKAKFANFEVTDNVN